MEQKDIKEGGEEKRCSGCVWNSEVWCGKVFCILPRCIVPQEEENE